MADTGITTERHDRLAIVWLDNHAKLNALNAAMLDSFAREFDTLAADPNIAALIVSGRGHRAFCAGADIAAWGDLAPFDFAHHWIARGHRLFDRIAATPKLTIAAINGDALGGGLELLAACDLRVAVRRATFALPEAAIGVIPGWGGTQRLARQIPPAVLKEMALSGARVDAERAYQIGFLNALVDADPVSCACDMALRSTALAPRAVEIAKYMINAACNENRAAMIDALAGGLAASTADKAEGVAAFTAKRPPKFTGC